MTTLSSIDSILVQIKQHSGTVQEKEVIELANKLHNVKEAIQRCEDIIGFLNDLDPELREKIGQKANITSQTLEALLQAAEQVAL